MVKSNQSKFSKLEIKELEKVHANPNYHKIGNYARSNYFYRYMGLGTALDCIENNFIRFVEPCSWEDKLESRFYKASIFGKKTSKNNPILFAYCLTNKKNSEAAWKIYTHNATGLNSLCVQFKIKRKEFRDELLRVIGTNGYDLYEGVVQYVYEKDLRYLHLPKIMENKKYVTNELYINFFTDFKLKHYLNLLLLKNDAFKHEEEIRFFLVPSKCSQLKKGSCNPVILNGFKWCDVIKEVHIDNNCTEREIKILEDVLKKKNIPLEKYCVYGTDSDTKNIYVRKPMGNRKNFALVLDFYMEIYGNGILLYKQQKDSLAALRECATYVGFQIDKKKDKIQNLGRKLLKNYCEGAPSGTIGEYHIEHLRDGRIDVYKIVNTSIKKELCQIAKDINCLTNYKNLNTQQLSTNIIKYAIEHPDKVINQK